VDIDHVMYDQYKENRLPPQWSTKCLFTRWPILKEQKKLQWHIH